MVSASFFLPRRARKTRSYCKLNTYIEMKCRGNTKLHIVTISCRDCFTPSRFFVPFVVKISKINFRLITIMTPQKTFFPNIVGVVFSKYFEYHVKSRFSDERRPLRSVVFCGICVDSDAYFPDYSGLRKKRRNFFERTEISPDFAGIYAETRSGIVQNNDSLMTQEKKP